MKWTSLFAGFFLAVTILSAPAFANEQQWLAGGHKSLQARQYDNAIKYYGAALKQNRRSAVAAEGLGRAYYAKGDKNRALQYFSYALKLKPNDARLKQMVATLSQGRGSGARTEGTNKNYAYGVAYLKRKNYPYAVQYLEKAAVEKPADPNVHQSLGNAYFGTKDMDKAIAAWEKALLLRPNAQLRAYVDSLKQRQATIAQGGEAAKKAQAQKTELPPGVPDHDNMSYNPWIMGGVVAVIGAIMLLVF